MEYQHLNDPADSGRSKPPDCVLVSDPVQIAGLALLQTLDQVPSETRGTQCHGCSGSRLHLPGQPGQAIVCCRRYLSLDVLVFPQSRPSCPPLPGLPDWIEIVRGCMTEQGISGTGLLQTRTRRLVFASDSSLKDSRRTSPCCQLDIDTLHPAAGV